MSIVLIVAVIAAFALGAVLAWWLATSHGREERAVLEHSLRETQLRWTEAREELAKAHEALREARENLAARQAEIAGLKTVGEAEKRASERMLEQMRTSLPDTFKALAGAVLEEKSKTFSEQNQAGLRQVLDPLNIQLRDFQQKIEQAHLDQAKGGEALRVQVEAMVQSTSIISEQANNLAGALRGSSKAQGMWGELILERALESAGLRRGYEYEAQESHPAENGRRLQPDVVIHLPGERHIVVDSKVSLVDYETYCHAETDTARTATLKGHLNSVRGHIKELSEKNYQSLYGLHSLDFVIMFLPIEPAFMLALSSDDKLLERAWKQNVLLVSPSTFLFVVRTVDYLWRQEQQKRNVEEIVRRGEELYNKLAAFVGEFTKVGMGLEQAQKSYENALNKLSTGRGNVIRQAEMLRALGVKPSKELPRGLVEVAQQEDLELEEVPTLPEPSDGTEEPGPSS